MNVYHWINLLGLAAGATGAIFTASNPFLTPEQAAEIGVSRFAHEKDEDNAKLPLPQALLRQSQRARMGLVLIGIGFLLQLIAAVPRMQVR